MGIYIPSGGGGGAASPLTLTAHNAGEIPLTVSAAPGQTADVLDIIAQAPLSNYGWRFLPNGLLENNRNGQVAYWGSDSAGNSVIQGAGGTTNLWVIYDGRLAIGTGQPGGWGGGVGPMIQLGYASVAPTAPGTANWGIIYISTSGALHYRGPTTDTQIAPA